MQNILLAAGLGSRSEGKKLLLPFQGTSIVANAVAASLEAGLFTIVVTGFRAEEVSEQLKSLACPSLLVVHNPDYAKGQGGSTQAGARHLHAGEPFFISLADMPLIGKKHYHWIAHHAHMDVVRPSYRGRYGQPVLLGTAFRQIILEEKLPFTMRSLLTRYPTQRLEVEDAAYVTDIDTLEAYQQLLATER